MKLVTKESFDNLIDKLKKLVQKYENNALHYNQYQFYLANGEKLSFEVMPQNVPHLLGINLDYLRATNMFKNKEAFLLLKEFLESSYSVYKGIQEGHLNFNSIFSDQIALKLEAFEQNIYFYSPSDIEFICQYDKSKTYQLGLEKDYPCDYFIAKTDILGNIYLLGLVKHVDSYIPMTNLMFLKDEDQNISLKKLLANQVLTFVNTIMVTNPVTNFKNTSRLPLAFKLEKIKILRKYKNLSFGTIIDVSSDYQFNTNGVIAKETKISTYRIICQQFMQTILSHEIFLIEQLDDTVREQLDEDMIGLIQVYNDEACKVGDSKAQVTYSQLLEQYNMLAIQVLELQKQLEMKEQEAIACYEQIQTLEQENVFYKEFHDDIINAVQKHL